MNPLLNNLRKTVYITFDALVDAFGGYNNFPRVFNIARFTGEIRYYIGYVGGSSKADYLNAIAKSFPQKSPAEHRIILKNYWREHQRIFLELFMYPSMNGENIGELIDFEGLEYVDHALSSGKGAILPVPHFGNVRLLHYALALKGCPVSVVSSEYAEDPELVRRFKLDRTSNVHQVGFRGQNPKWIIDALKQNRLVQIASTAEAGNNGVEVELLNRRLFFTSGWVRLALTTGAPILPTYIQRKPDNRQVIKVLPPLKVEKASNRNEIISAAAQKLMNLYEPIYRQFPHLIDWMSWMVRLREARQRFGEDV